MLITYYYNSIRLKLTLTSFLLLCCICSYSQIKRAFLVGISNYQLNNNTREDAWHNIHGANDVALLTPTLKRYGFKITSLCNNAATAHNIRHSLKKFAASCKPGDIIYLHFSCHGQPIEDIDGDENDGWDESIIPIDAGKVYIKGQYTGDNHITDDELNTLFKTIRSKVGKVGHVTVVVDACHAGSSYRGEEDYDSVITRGTNLGFSEKGIKFVPKIDKRSKIRIENSVSLSSIHLIEACRSYQVNSEIKIGNVYYGSLSFYVNKVLKSRNIDWRSHWYDDVINLMSKDTRLIRQNAVIETSE